MEKNTNLPNLFVVGAAKAGTTSLVEYLGQNKDIFVPKNKEPRYLSYSFLKDKYKGKGDDFTKKLTLKSFEAYKKSYTNGKDSKIRIDGSVEALYYYKDIIPKIKKIHEDPYIIIMLRDPVKRAISAYSHLIREEREIYSFEDGIAKIEERKKAGYEFIWDYIGASRYYNPVQAYLSSFDKTKVIIFEDFVSDPVKSVNEALEFLGVENKHDFIPSRHNISGSPKLKHLNRFLNGKNVVKDALKNVIGRDRGLLIKNAIQRRNLRPLTIEEQTKANLYLKFKEETELLERLLVKDLSIWSKPYNA